MANDAFILCISSFIVFLFSNELLISYFSVVSWPEHLFCQSIQIIRKSLLFLNMCLYAMGKVKASYFNSCNNWPSIIILSIIL